MGTNTEYARVIQAFVLGMYITCTNIEHMYKHKTYI
jgi:hypothetical protein